MSVITVLLLQALRWLQFLFLMLFSPFLSLAICLHHLFILFWWTLFLFIDLLQCQNFFPPFVFSNLQWFQVATSEVILSLSVLLQLVVILLSSASLK